ncbi:hypothetical protein L208DRAFT_1238246 [Tricholoma matsutake]|nr:hypothetical protein L208DRAFT_1238246 [Tricholoma matsutake 945]
MLPLSRASDPFVHYRRHFGRTVHAMCSIQALLTNSIVHMGEEGEVVEESLTPEQHRAFQKLLHIVPHLPERLMEASNEECIAIADLIQRGISSARSDDTKSLKGIVLEWMSPPGIPLNPPLSRNVKTNRGYHHPVTGTLLCPAGLDWNDADIREKLSSGKMPVHGDQWPMLVYADQEYDPQDPWEGLFRSRILIWAFKHIFTSPSSVEKEVKATRSGNARIHGMTRVTTASLAYVAMQLRFALSSSLVFSRSDAVTDSKRFYESVLDFLDDPEEKVEVGDLLNWWNW